MVGDLAVTLESPWSACPEKPVLVLFAFRWAAAPFLTHLDPEPSQNDPTSRKLPVFATLMVWKVNKNRVKTQKISSRISSKACSSTCHFNHADCRVSKVLVNLKLRNSPATSPSTCMESKYKASQQFGTKQFLLERIRWLSLFVALSLYSHVPAQELFVKFWGKLHLA